MNKKPKILVVGSFVLDQIATTEVFPHEGQTVLGKSFSKATGGKGANQAVQAARLGADVTMFGKLGKDANGNELIQACKASKVNTEKVVYDENVSSSCAVIVLEQVPGGQTKNRIIVIPGSNMTITRDDIAFLEKEIAEYDLVMLQLEIPMEINEKVAEYAKKKNVSVMLNSAPSAPLSDKLLSCLTYISPNEHEAADITGIHIKHEGKTFDVEAARAATDVLRKKGVKNVLITLGEAGAVLANDDGFFISPCISGIKAVDPTAAGDSFVGAFCVGACCGWNWNDILSFANHTAAITVSNMGAMPSLPYLDKVESLMQQKYGRVPNTEILKKV